jgi:hypothetical protein
MYYSYVEIEYVATSFSLTRTDLALKLLINGKVNKDDKTIHISNVSDKTAAPDESIHHGTLMFDPSPPIAEDEDIPFATADDQAELMQWHYRLGHLAFQKLKQLALNGKIPQKLSKLKPLKCAGCLFGAMTKLPWRGKESALSHKNLCRHQAEGDSLSQPNGIDRGGLFWPVEGVSNQEAVQTLHCFCGPLLPIAFCAPPN